MRSVLLVCLALAFASNAIACSSTEPANPAAAAVDASPQDVTVAEASEPSCSTDADCPSGLGCGFSIRDGCNAKGRCVKVEHGGGPECQPTTWRCACDGGSTEVINFDGPDHLTTRPSTDGVCEGPNPEGAPCSLGYRCGEGLLCAYAVARGCFHCGECIRPTGCTSPKTTGVACDCNGVEFPLHCMYPDGWAPVPVSSMGACGLDGGADAIAPSDASHDGD